MLHEKVNVAPLFILILVFVAIIGLILGAAFFQPPVGKGVGHMDRVVEKPILFDRPLTKGVENLNWNK